MLVFMYFDAVFTKRRFTDTHATKTKSVPFDDFFDAYDDFQSRAIRFPAYDKTTCKSEACMKTSKCFKQFREQILGNAGEFLFV